MHEVENSFDFVIHRFIKSAHNALWNATGV